MNKKVPIYAREFHNYTTKNVSNTNKLIISALLSILAALFQSFGGFLPGIGYLLSPFASAPIILAVLISYKHGIMVYFSTLLLLLIIQPSELIIFPLTTGLLGASLGIGLNVFNKRLKIIIFSSVSLFMGISIILYIFNFPLLGPGIATKFNLLSLFFIYLFCFFYAWGWMVLINMLLKRFNKILADVFPGKRSK